MFGSRGQLDKSRTNPGMLANKNNRKPYDSIDEIGKNHQEQETYITESKINLRPSSYDNRDSKYSSPSSPAFPNQPNFSFQPQLSIDTQKSHLQSPTSINSPISSPVKDSIYKDEKTPTQALMNARIHDNPSTTFVEIADLKRLLSDVVMNSTYVAKHLNDKDRLLKTILEIKDGFNSRIEDLMELKTWLKDGDVGFVVLNQLLFTLHSTAWNLNKKFLKALNGASPDKSSSPIAKLPTNTRILFNRSKITAFTGKLNEAWNQLMLQIAILLAEKSSKSSAVAALHVTQLAIATGAADWQDITLDDAGLLYIQGDRYLFGFGVAQSYEIAHRRYLVAARAGLPEAINMLGLMAENGLGQSKDMSLAFKWYKEASALGCLDSINNLGRIYQNGIGCAVELTAAREYYFNAANKGHLDASCNYGHFLEHGLGGEVNLQAAFQWYKLAADKNYAKGQNALGSIYHNGIQGYLEKNQEEAISLFRQAAAQGNSHALNNLGICYEEGKGVAKDLGIAKQFYKEAASLKHPKATNNYGWILLLEVF